MLETITKTLREAGVYFQREHLAGLEPKGKCTIRHDPDNKYDAKCLDIMWKKHLIGHIPAKTKEQQAIYDSLQAGRGVKCKITRLTTSETKEGLKTPDLIDVEVEYQVEGKECLTEGHNIIEKESITEPGVIIDFNETLHRYIVRKTGKILTGGTTRIKKYLKGFDKGAMLPRCEKAWGVAADAIEAIWKRKGDNAALFGTAIHNALETYELYRASGDIIQQAKKDCEENYALPSHTILKNILLDFIHEARPIESDYGVQEIIPEALITDVETGSCGLIDRLMIINKKKKICRIGDYKVNMEVEKRKDKILAPYGKLPANKLGKFTLQLSDYAAIMEKHGWTVLGGDVFVLGEDGWKHYPLELVDMRSVFE